MGSGIGVSRACCQQNLSHCVRWSRTQASAGRGPTHAGVARGCRTTNVVVVGFAAGWELAARPKNGSNWFFGVCSRIRVGCAPVCAMCACSVGARIAFWGAGGAWCGWVRYRCGTCVLFGRGADRKGSRSAPTRAYSSGTNHTAPNGGTWTTALYGLPCHSTSSACTRPMLPTPEPPYSAASVFTTSRQAPPSGSPMR